jgi:hypothetical protein
VAYKEEEGVIVMGTKKGQAATYFGKLCKKHPDDKGLRYERNDHCPLCARDAAREFYRAVGIKKGVTDPTYTPQAHKLNKLWPAPKKGT